MNIRRVNNESKIEKWERFSEAEPFFGLYIPLSKCVKASPYLTEKLKKRYYLK